MARYKKLTKLQEKSLFTIARYIKENSKSPTRQELVPLLEQKSTNGVNQILYLIARKGYIKIEPPRKKRNIKILHTPDIQLDLFLKVEF